MLRIFEPGEELEMFQWGQAGQEVATARWWTSWDIDAPHSIPGQMVEVLAVLEGKLPPADA
ncbi:hypothetical protein [Streptomyces sp. NPDC047725]|uniref:hypothetical protein n=1 Tax=Streptomyces sp. NPDC047725 TaxID=3365487 RepID=UPI0037119DA3